MVREQIAETQPGNQGGGPPTPVRSCPKRPSISPNQAEPGEGSIGITQSADPRLDTTGASATFPHPARIRVPGKRSESPSGAVAQLVRVPDCRSGGCGFESRPPRLEMPLALRQGRFLICGMMTNGALRLTAPDETSVLPQIGLAVEEPLDGVGVNLPEYQLEFDIIIDNLSEEFDRFTVFFDSPRVNTISFRNDGYIRQGFFNRIGTFQEGALLHFDVAFLTDEELIRIDINGTAFYSGPTQFEATGGLRTIRFSLSDRDVRDSVVYVDNIVVRGVPEPAVAPLLWP